VEVHLHTFLASVLDEGKWSVSLTPGPFYAQWKSLW